MREVHLGGNAPASLSVARHRSHSPLGGRYVTTQPHICGWSSQRASAINQLSQAESSSGVLS
jgi:hypothetical protein